MQKIEGAFSTEVRLEDEESETICKFRGGVECCAFLGADGKGFRCLRMDYPLNETIFNRLKDGTMNAKGKGGWSGCAWEEELK